uniref:Nucleoporin 88 n=1 Tax=Neogobius melanostomus TaxID=47308 RepID=A0A8C6SFP4_9GOBI
CRHPEALVGNTTWRTDLPDHAMFTKIRENLQVEPYGSERGVAKNLVFCVGGDFFLWDEASRAFYTTNLRQLNVSQEVPGNGKYQTLMCINPPFFEVSQVLLSPTRHHAALIGKRGVCVLELPQRWGKKSEFEGGKSEINCRTIPVAERFFTSSPSVSLRQAAWFPSETGEPHLVFLTSDNTIRFYSLKSPQTPAKILSLSQSEDDSATHQPARSFAASLGEIAVAFDFGPVCSAPRKLAAHLSKEHVIYPLYILYENGETYLSYTSQSNGITLSKPAGPLPMYPAAEDNYGYDCVELELTLKVAAGEDEEPLEFDFTCLIQLHRDPLCQHRYHCTHEAGVHSVGLIWINKLQTFLHSGEEDKDSLQELAAEKRCIVEHILCTKPLPISESAPVRGFVILSDLSLGATMICITNSFECILLPLLSSIRPPSPPLLCSHPGPGLGSSPLSTNPIVLKECLQLLSRATQVFREEYILKQDMAREELQKRVKLLRGQKNKQLEELALCREEKKSLREAAERLADKYEDAKYRQETITNRVKKVLGSLQNQLPILSSSEKDMKKELQSINDQLKNLDNSIKQVNMKMEYQKTQLDKDQAAEKTPVQLNAQQKKVVQDVLREQAQQIGDIMKQIKDIKNHFNF